MRAILLPGARRRLLPPYRLFGKRHLGRSHPDPEHAARISDSILFGGPQNNCQTEAADDTRMRSLLTPFFSARRMQELRPHVEALADQLPPRAGRSEAR